MTERASTGLASIKDIGKSYGSTPVLQKVSFSLRSGLTIIVGPNAAGKSTLLRILSGVEKADAGTIEGLNPLTIGYAPQHLNPPSSIRVDQFLEYMCWARRIPRQERCQAISNALRDTDCTDYAVHKFGALSGGTRQRVNICQAILASPEILLLDEPWEGLDPTQRSEIRELILRIGRDRPCLLTTHLIEELACADYVVMISRGMIVFEGNREAFLEHGRWEGLDSKASQFEKAFIKLSRL